MKNVKTKLVLVLLMFLNSELHARQSTLGSPVLAPEKIVKDMMSWLHYDRDYLRLSEDFTAYSETSGKISKGQFLDRIAGGKSFPVRLSTKDGSLSYKLYKMPLSASADLKMIIKDYGRRYNEDYQREGKRMPSFSFVDLNGNKYNQANTKGKIVVIKCWFIACGACVEEMPRLNELVNQYKNRKDVIFISLASDAKPALNAFLKKKKFSYPVVAKQESFMSNDLKIDSYPTHIIVDQRGLVAKVVTNVQELIPALEKVASR